MITLHDVQETRSRFPDDIIRTPLIFSGDLRDMLRHEVYCKAENLQVTGSYKARAAFNILNSIPREQRPQGAAISSSGNFASAFSFMGRLLGIPTTVVMMEKTAPFKIEKNKRYGSRVVLCENRFEARWETLDRLQQEEGLRSINTFEAPEVTTAHGSIGLEILEDLPDVDVILVPVSSGALLAGIALSVKAVRPKTRVIGVQPHGSNATYLSFQQGRPTRIDTVDTICDALIATRPGDLPFEYIKKYVDDVVVVDDAIVVKALRLLFETAKLVAEPAGAVGIAALLAGAVTVRDEKVAVLLSGGNVAPERFAKFISA